MLRPVTSWLCCWGYNTLPVPHRPRPVKKHLGPWGRCLIGNVGRGDLYPFFTRLLWGFLARELGPLCVSVCEALLALETGRLWASPTGVAVWALPTKVVLWTPPVVSGGSAELWPAALGLWVLPTEDQVVVWTPSLGVSRWAPSKLDFSRLLSRIP